jgi:hypothetical protein
MITGAHTIVYSTDPEADRAFFARPLGLPAVDAGGGWLIFGLPPAEVAFHPARRNDRHELCLICADIEAFRAAMAERGTTVSPIAEEPRGRLVHIVLPGGGRLGVYEARHERPPIAGPKPAEGEYPVLDPGPGRDPDGTRLRRGGCSCGAVRFELRGEPIKVGLCHCSECRKATGGAYLAYADWPRAAFSLVGAAAEYAGRSFCANCGSRLFHLQEEDGSVEVMLGALDEAPGDLVPTREGWICRREPWLAPVADAGQFERDPG